MKALRKIYNGFTLMEKILVTALFMFITLAVVFDVLRRKLFGISLPWIEELSRYALVYCTMICASMGISIDGHTRMDAVTDLLHGKVAKIVRILSNLIPAVGCFYLGIHPCHQDDDGRYHDHRSENSPVDLLSHHASGNGWHGDPFAGAGYSGYLQIQCS